MAGVNVFECFQTFRVSEVKCVCECGVAIWLLMYSSCICRLALNLKYTIHCCIMYATSARTPLSDTLRYFWICTAIFDLLGVFLWWLAILYAVVWCAAIIRFCVVAPIRSINFNKTHKHNQQRKILHSNLSISLFSSSFSSTRRFRMGLRYCSNRGRFNWGEEHSWCKWSSIW